MLYNDPSKNAKYNFYFGIPHTHTSYSDGQGRPIDAFEYARGKNLNFLFIADHSNFLDGVKHKNFEYNKQKKQYCEMEGSQWCSTRKEVEFTNNKYKDFVALRGFEMRWFAGGHISILNSQNYLNGRKQHYNMDKLTNWLGSQNNVVATINHPNRSFAPIKYNIELNKVLKLVEVGNGAFPRNYIRCESNYYKLLDLGWQLGAINGQDNHICNWGDSDNLTVILAEALNKDALIDAMGKLRTYSTETRSLKLIFKANNFWMGSTINANNNDLINFEISADDKSVPIEKIQLISKGGSIIKELQCNNMNKVTWRPSLIVNNNESWYIVKIIHSNGSWGISSPIFIKTKDNY
ncbi:MAG: hypothetical protein K0R09_2518 [Clostridiales bacterium]|nr:hypothetical protein [Clostridiales bacterium]